MESIYLRAAREARKLTQVQLAALVGLTQNAISRLEITNGADATAETLLKLAAALDVDPRALRFGPDPKHQEVA